MRMRGYVILLVIFCLFLCFTNAIAGSANPDKTVIGYFEACRNGDVETMRMLMAGSFYDNKMVLLTKNKDYPEFLKKYYRDVRIVIVSSSIGDIDMVARDHPELYERYHRENGYTVDVGNDEIAVVSFSQEFPDGSTLNKEFLLKKDNIDNWKIYEQVLSQ